jgi:hypothetical protein
MFRSIFATLLLVSNVVIGQESQPAPEPAAPATEAPAPSLAVDAIAVCRSVEARTPVGESDSFPNDVGSLTCFVRVTGAEAETQTYHRWYAGDTLVREIPISVKSSPLRCWSVKSIQENWTGACRVDVVNESGDVLGSKSFTLTAAAAAEPQG